MNLKERISALQFLSNYILKNDEMLKLKKNEAFAANAWFIKEFVDIALQHCANEYLNEEKLTQWILQYQSSIENKKQQTIGIIMAGNIPLVGFHDFISAFITGNISRIKLSSKDQILMRHLLDVLIETYPNAAAYIQISNNFKDVDKLIATGSDNSSRYFEYYFKDINHLIRKNRNSIAILHGNESNEKLQLVAKDIMLYFGLGCRSVSKLYVPENYNFEPLLQAFEVFRYLENNQKYMNNFDYNLSIALLSKKYYMSNNLILLLENESFASRISNVHYQYYNDINELQSEIISNLDKLQCIVSAENNLNVDLIYPGKTQFPCLTEYADNVNLLEFMLE
jgi:hypothetical protein